MNEINRLPSKAEVQPILENFSKGEFAQAKNLSLSLYAKYPNAIFLLNILGLCSLNLAKSDEAETFLRKAYKIAPDNFETCSNLGLILQQIGKYEEAEPFLQSAIKINSSIPQLHFNLGLTQEALKLYEQAIKSYDEAARLKPDFGQAFFNKGLIEWKLKSYEMALVCLKRAKKLISPEDPLILASIGGVYKEMLDYSSAEEYTLAALKIREEPKFFFNLATIKRDQGNISGAKDLYEKIIGIDANFPEAFNNLGEIYRDLGDSDKAKKMFEKALVIKPNMNKPNYNLALLHQDSENYLEAANYFEKSQIEDWLAKVCYCYYKDSNFENFEKYLSLAIKRKHWSPLIASITNHFEINHKRENSYNFCAKPFEFIRKESIEILKNNSRFKNELLRDLQNSEIGVRKQGRLINGIQSAGNLLKRSENSLKVLAGHILVEVDNYVSAFEGEANEFIQSFPKIPLFQSSWYVKMNKGGHLTPHIHETAWLSGVLYLKLPKGQSPEMEGMIEFGYDGDGYPKADIQNESKIIAIEEGDILLFPSSLFHRTIPFETDEDRICIAFDIAPPPTP